MRRMGLSQTDHQIQMTSISEDQAGLKGDRILLSAEGQVEEASIAHSATSSLSRRTKFRLKTPNFWALLLFEDPSSYFLFHSISSCSLKVQKMFFLRWLERCFEFQLCDVCPSSHFCPLGFLALDLILSLMESMFLCQPWLPIPPPAQLYEGWPRNDPLLWLFLQGWRPLCSGCISVPGWAPSYLRRNNHCRLPPGVSMEMSRRSSLCSKFNQINKIKSRTWNNINKKSHWSTDLKEVPY